ncbi:MAG: polysulfide reductase NrfD [Thermoanaerobaculia bacterium]|nr:polysulfide reductase NrfD [Thermoanaerobaculia bacterium]
MATAAAEIDATSVLDRIDPVERRPELIEGKPDFHSITEAVAAPTEWTPPIGWWIFLGASVSCLGLLGISIGWLFWEGVGIWGNNIPVAWAWPIVNFVFWVGIGHAGTLISAVLFLLRQRWRTSINRAAEAMTIFAVMCALIFPGIHIGRPWLPYWMLPIPNQMQMWPQFRSPLMWDVFAVSIYGTVSLLFWYLGLIPDLATLRDRAKTKLRRLAYGTFALGWRGSFRQWLHYEKAYLLLAGLATPLVLSVHSVVSFDFATSQLPGWHTTIFPPYFVAGAIFSGIAMVVTLMVVCRVLFKMEHIINLLHFDRMAKLLLLTGSLVGYAYSLEFFVAWYSGNEYETFTFINRATGPFAWAYWTMVTCNVVTPQIFWWKRARVSIPILFVASILINIGMWFERFVIVVTSLHADFLPSSWSYYRPTFWDAATFLGSFGLFFTMFTLFVRFLPMVAMAEVKSVLPQAHVHAGGHASEGHAH